MNKSMPSSTTEDKEPCRHGTMCFVYPDGTLRTLECRKCCEERDFKEKQEEDARRKETTYRSVMAEIGGGFIPKRFADKTLDNYQAVNDVQKSLVTVCKKFVGGFEGLLSGGVSMIFCGKPGTGKTHLAYAIVNSLQKRCFPSLVITAADMTSEIKNAYKSDDPETNPQSVSRRYSRISLLVIDEVGVQVDSDAEKRIFFDVMNKRYENMLPTIMISNLSKVELTSLVGERVMDRMKENGGMVFAFDWVSHRR